MWNAMFDLHLSLGEKVIRAVVIYLFLVIALRLVGKRELTQLNTLDFVVLLAVANAVQNGLIGEDNSVTGAVVGASVLFLLASGLGWLLYRSGLLRRAVEGSPTLLVREGPGRRPAQRGDDARRPARGDPGRRRRHRRRCAHGVAAPQRQGDGRTKGDQPGVPPVRRPQGADRPPHHAGRAAVA
jgi:hypothetical protein